MSQAQTHHCHLPLLLIKLSPHCSGQSMCLKPWVHVYKKPYTPTRRPSVYRTPTPPYFCYPPSRVLPVTVISSRVLSRKPFCVVSKHLRTVPTLCLPLIASSINHVAFLFFIPSPLGTTLVPGGNNSNDHHQTTWNMPGRFVPSKGNPLAPPQSRSNQVRILVGNSLRRLSLSISTQCASHHSTLYHHHVRSTFGLLTADPSPFSSQDRLIRNGASILFPRPL